MRTHPAVRFTSILLAFDGRWPASKQFLLSNSHPVAQLIHVTNGDYLVSRDATLNLNHVAFRLAALHQTLLRKTVLDHKNISRAGNCSQRALRHHQGSSFL